MKSQLESTQVEKRVEDLTAEVRDLTIEAQKVARKTDRDSSYILFITLITAFYVPGSFVAVRTVKSILVYPDFSFSQTIFGTNFFDYSADNHRMIVATNFYVFVVTWSVWT